MVNICENIIKLEEYSIKWVAKLRDKKIMISFH